MRCLQIIGPVRFFITVLDNQVTSALGCTCRSAPPVTKCAVCYEKERMPSYVLHRENRFGWKPRCVIEKEVLHTRLDYSPDVRVAVTA